MSLIELSWTAKNDKCEKMLCDTLWNHPQDNFYNWWYLVWWCQGGSPLLCLPRERWEGENTSSLVHPLCQGQPNDRFLDFLSHFGFFGNSHEPGAGMAGLLSWCPFFLSSCFWVLNYSNAVLTTFLVSLASRFRFEHNLVLFTFFSLSQVWNTFGFSENIFINPGSDHCFPLSITQWPAQNLANKCIKPNLPNQPNPPNQKQRNQSYQT